MHTLPTFEASIVFLETQFKPRLTLPITLEGRVKTSTPNNIAIGSIDPGSLNLGVRILELRTGKLHYEGRASFLDGHLITGVWQNFKIVLPALVLSSDTYILFLGFVYEERFWFYERNMPAEHIHVRFALRDKSTEEDQNSLPSPEIDVSPHRVLLDVTDLFHHWRGRTHPSGIQRVQINIFLSLLSVNTESQPIPLIFDFRRYRWVTLMQSALLDIVESVASPTQSDEDWIERLHNVVDRGHSHVPKHGDVLLALGSSWWVPDYAHKIGVLIRDCGTHYIPFIHDVIPLALPALCDPVLGSQFKLWFTNVIPLATLVLVNSADTAQQVNHWASNTCNKKISIEVLHLNAVPIIKPMPDTEVFKQTTLSTPFVLCVGTIEMRKNQSMLVEVWFELKKRFASSSLPRLILIGALGWPYKQASDVSRYMADLSGIVEIRQNVSDAELSELYRNCLFTIFPSLSEGWGLPVIESQAHKKLAICSTTPALRESASAGDIFLDPNDVNAWVTELSLLISDRDTLSEKTALSILRSKLRTWSDVAASLRAIIKSTSVEIKTFEEEQIEDGIIYDFSDYTAETSHQLSAGRFRQGPGWHQLESWGVWTAPGSSEVRFVTTHKQCTRFLYVAVQGRSEAVHLECWLDTIRQHDLIVAPGAQRVVRTVFSDTSKGSHVLRLVVDKLQDLTALTSGQDTRKIGIGVLRLLVVEESDFKARVEFLDKAL